MYEGGEREKKTIKGDYTRTHYIGVGAVVALLLARYHFKSFNGLFLLRTP